MIAFINLKNELIDLSHEYIKVKLRIILKNNNNNIN